MLHMNTALQEWIDNGGSALNLARELNTDRQLVYYWCKNGIPKWRIASVAEKTGISEEKLREGNKSDG